MGSNLFYLNWQVNFYQVNEQESCVKVEVFGFHPVFISVTYGPYLDFFLFLNEKV